MLLFSSSSSFYDDVVPYYLIMLSLMVSDFVPIMILDGFGNGSNSLRCVYGFCHKGCFKYKGGGEDGFMGNTDLGTSDIHWCFILI